MKLTLRFIKFEYYMRQSRYLCAP